MVTAIILAGGVGSRVGAGRPKQFIEVLGSNGVQGVQTRLKRKDRFESK